MLLQYLLNFLYHPFSFLVFLQSDLVQLFNLDDENSEKKGARQSFLRPWPGTFWNLFGFLVLPFGKNRLFTLHC